MTEKNICKRGDFTEILKTFWSLLNEKEQQKLQGNLTVASFKKNELIYREGESPDHLLGVVSGKVKIYRDGVGGRSQIIRVLRPGEYFGYRASLAREPYVTAAAAFEQTTLCCIPMTLINDLLAQNNRLARFFIAELATDLGISDRRTVSLTQKHVRGRLAESLLYLKDVYGLDEEDKSLGIHLTREDLASLSNMTTSNAIRTLSTFANEGLVAIKGKNIIITNEKELAHISHCG